jgi:hypothetical protein
MKLASLIAQFPEYSQFDGFVPIDDVTGKSERLKTDYVNVASFGPNVKPFTLERHVTVADPVYKRKFTSSKKL